MHGIILNSWHALNDLKGEKYTCFTEIKRGNDDEETPRATDREGGVWGDERFMGGAVSHAPYPIYTQIQIEENHVFLIKK